jgi:hypothetical protein
MPDSDDHLLILVRLLLAHLAADFLLQTRRMVENKGWFTRWMGAHIGMVFLTAWFFSSSLNAALLISFIHWVTDGLKTEAAKRWKNGGVVLFTGDQIVHVLSILFVWQMSDTMKFNRPLLPWPDLNSGFVLLAYGFVTGPVFYIIQYALNQNRAMQHDETLRDENKHFGQYERMAVLTLSWFGQFIAISILVAARIWYLQSTESDGVRREHRLLATVMGFTFALISGVLLQQVLQP